MSISDIGDAILKHRRNAEVWLHVVQTETNNISSLPEFNAALNGYIEGARRAHKEMSEHKELVERICKNLMRIHKGDLQEAASELAELLIRPQPEIKELLKKYVGESWIYEERWKNWEE